MVINGKTGEIVKAVIHRICEWDRMAYPMDTRIKNKKSRASSARLLSYKTYLVLELFAFYVRINLVTNR